MSLPPEIRLMVNDSAMPEEVHLATIKHTLGLPPTIISLMSVKPIRDELIPHMFARYHFHWTNSSSGRQVLSHDHAWDRFKRHAVPYINSLTVRFEGLVLQQSSQISYYFLERLLTWARWRSLRPHLHPWNLKNLTLVEAYNLSSFRLRLPWTSAEPSDPAADRFLINVCVVPGLESLKIVLNHRAGEEAIREFLDRCASCEIDGKVGYSPYGEEKVSEWFCLQDDQVIRVDG